MKKLLTLILAVSFLLGAAIGAIAQEDVQSEPARFVVRSNSNKENKTENDKIKALIEEKSGIDFEVIVVAENSWAEKINVMIAGSEKFDTLNLTANGNNWSTYASNNAIVPYTQEMLDNYLPDVMAMIPEEAWIPCTDKEGNIWALPRHESFTAGGVPSIRTDWLENLGMEMPTTLEELEAYFEGVKTQDVNGNGDPNDEYGYIPYFQSLFNGPLHVYYLGTHGGCDEKDHYLSEDGTVMPWYMHPNAWALVSKGAQWYQNGYINQDYLTMTNETANDMGALDRIGMCSGWYNMGLQGTERLVEANPDSTCAWAAIPNFTDSPGGINAWGGNAEYNGEVALSATSTDPQWALKLLNWIYESEENYMLATYGIEGDHWILSEDGKTFTQPDGATDRYMLEYQLLEWYDYSKYPEPYVGKDTSTWRAYTAWEMRNQIDAGIQTIPRFDYYVPYDLNGTEAEFLTNDAQTLIQEAMEKALVGNLTEEEWNTVVQTAWDIDGQIRSAVWTEQYHNFVN
ncbi:MAG: extracellular solute-binding protein [Clostridiales bacterium]|nr:extracellular solute-binding protein [Clostridiales bacterium]